MEKAYSREEARRNGWFMVVLCIFMSTFGSTKLCWSLFSSDLIAQNGWTNLQASLPYTGINVASGIGSVIAGMSADSKNPGRVAAVGGVLVGLSLIMMGLQSSNWVIVFAFGIAMGIGEVITNIGMTTSAIKWLPSGDQGKATGLATAGLATTSIIIPPIYTALYARYGLTGALVVIGAAVCVFCIIIGLLFKPAPRSVIERNLEDARKSASTAEEDKKVRRMFATPYADLDWKSSLKTPQFWYMFLVFFVVMAAFLALASQIVVIIDTRVNVPVPSWLILACSGGGALLGRIIGGQIADRIGIFRAWAFMCILLALTLVLMPLTGSWIVLYFLYALNTFCVHSIVVYDYAAHGVLFNRECSGLLTGIGSLSYAISSVVGPTFASLCADRIGSYTPVFYVFAVATALCFIPMILVHRWTEKIMNGQAENA